MENRIEKQIDDLVGVFTDPIIVFPGGWGETLPDWLKPAITIERLEMCMRETKGEEPTGTDAEVCAYLYAACLTQPPDHDWAQIYIYIASKTFKRHRQGEVPEDIAVGSLTDDQQRQLKELKQWIYERRVKAREERRRVERRRAREEAAARAPKQLALPS